MCSVRSAYNTLRIPLAIIHQTSTALMLFLTMISYPRGGAFHMPSHPGKEICESRHMLMHAFNVHSMRWSNCQFLCLLVPTPLLFWSFVLRVQHIVYHLNKLPPTSPSLSHFPPPSTRHTHPEREGGGRGEHPPFLFP